MAYLRIAARSPGNHPVPDTSARRDFSAVNPVFGDSGPGYSALNSIRFATVSTQSSAERFSDSFRSLIADGPEPGIASRTVAVVIVERDG
ncbi:hypothetical protein AB0G74_12960 [Streptomyces sp. NPDC020875]|uniref:hypothetical protein n=1 Tax=Streptomyces sp. NPDC020875 TaxID=3154898 RepID=UPI00340664FD